MDKGHKHSNDTHLRSTEAVTGYHVEAADGEIGHVHFQDVPDMPRELLDSTTRIIPGDGISPLKVILGKLAEKGYAGPLSVELFLPKFKDGDPFEIAREIRRKSEAVMRESGVM